VPYGTAKYATYNAEEIAVPSKNAENASARREWILAMRTGST
jgi:hypothetical protein